jgi:hypothetical protein
MFFFVILYPPPFLQPFVQKRHCRKFLSFITSLLFSLFNIYDISGSHGVSKITGLVGRDAV